MQTASVSVIIPAYNEAQTISSVIKKIRELYPDVEIIEAMTLQFD